MAKNGFSGLHNYIDDLIYCGLLAVLHILDTILVHCILHILGTVLVHCLI